MCDDNDYAARAKADYHEKARAAGVPAITSGGIYPGVSNVMAAHMVSTARREYDNDGHFVGKDGANKADAVEPKKLQYFYYTAGTGEFGFHTSCPQHAKKASCYCSALRCVRFMQLGVGTFCLFQVTRPKHSCTQKKVLHQNTITECKTKMRC